MIRVGESVTSSFSRPYHHRGRIPLWVKVNPSRPYIRGGNVLEAFFTMAASSERCLPAHSLYLKGGPMTG